MSFGPSAFAVLFFFVAFESWWTKNSTSVLLHTHWSRSCSGLKKKIFKLKEKEIQAYHNTITNCWQNMGALYSYGVHKDHPLPMERLSYGSKQPKINDFICFHHFIMLFFLPWFLFFTFLLNLKCFTNFERDWKRNTIVWYFLNVRRISNIFFVYLLWSLSKTNQHNSQSQFHCHILFTNIDPNKSARYS